jgi:hypothetical protein
MSKIKKTTQVISNRSFCIYCRTLLIDLENDKYHIECYDLVEEYNRRQRQNNLIRWVHYSAITLMDTLGDRDTMASAAVNDINITESIINGRCLPNFSDSGHSIVQYSKHVENPCFRHLGLLAERHGDESVLRNVHFNYNDSGEPERLFHWQMHGLAGRDWDSKFNAIFGAFIIEWYFSGPKLFINVITEGLFFNVHEFIYELNVPTYWVIRQEMETEGTYPFFDDLVDLFRR